MLLHHSVQDNIALLRQARELLDRVTDPTYSRPAHPASPASAGAHLRHVLDHYQAFLSGWGQGWIDYDARERDPRIESDREAATLALARVSRALGDLSPEILHRPVQVRLDTDPTGSEAPTWCASSVDRELAFLVSHTVHHFALMAVAVRLHGVDPGPEFGFAPSTLRYLASHDTCVR